MYTVWPTSRHIHTHTYMQSGLHRGTYWESGHERAVYGVAVDSLNELLVSGSYDGTVKVCMYVCMYVCMFCFNAYVD